MPGARKGADLRRDARFALHSASVDPPEGGGWTGDAKVAGRAVLLGPLTGAVAGDAFRADIDEAVLTGLDETETRLVIELWRSGAPLRRFERA